MQGEQRFAEDRAFFMQEIENGKKQKEELKAKIQELERDLEYEMQYNTQLFAEEQVTQLCQRAYFSHQLIDKELELVRQREKIEF